MGSKVWRIVDGGVVYGWSLGGGPWVVVLGVNTDALVKGIRVRHYG